MLTRRLISLVFVSLVLLGLFLLSDARQPDVEQVIFAGGGCSGDFYAVSTPLNDLGSGEYMRLSNPPGGPPTATGEQGGLYPNGQNHRPAAHELAGVAIAGSIVPLNTSGNPASNGRIVMIGIGMSNAAAEFQEFVFLANADADVNPLLAIVNGAQPGRIAQHWADPNSDAWTEVNNRMASGGLTPAQVQVAWVKMARAYNGNSAFPTETEWLRANLEDIVQNLKTHYPNIKLAYLSSRTRSYTYWMGLSPEPIAFETGFAVKWLLEQQIVDGELNYNANNGPVVAPWLSWGPYLWIDGENPRSDGRVWTQADLAPDCTHPSPSGELKVAEMLLEFFKTDSTTFTWFLSNGGYPHQIYQPTVLRN